MPDQGQWNRISDSDLRRLLGVDHPQPETAPPSDTSGRSSGGSARSRPSPPDRKGVFVYLDLEVVQRLYAEQDRRRRGRAPGRERTLSSIVADAILHAYPAASSSR